MKTKFLPNYCIHPGIFLKEELKLLNIKQTELSEKTGLSKTVINEVIKGKRDINARMAVLFEQILESPAKYWLNLQSIYNEAIARIHLNLEKNKIVNLKCNKIQINFNQIQQVYNFNRKNILEAA